MILRNNNLVGGHNQHGGRVDMPEQNKKAFEEGVYLIFMRWTALQLAIINEWGGSESKEKAKSLFEEVLDWFYNAKGTSPQEEEEEGKRRSSLSRLSSLVRTSQSQRYHAYSSTSHSHLMRAYSVRYP